MRAIATVVTGGRWFIVDANEMDFRDPDYDLIVDVEELIGDDRIDLAQGGAYRPGEKYDFDEVLARDINWVILEYGEPDPLPRPRLRKKAYAVRRARLSGGYDYREVSAGVWEKVSTGRKSTGFTRPGPWRYCQFCGKRMAASQGVIKFAVNEEYWSCGEHGEDVKTNGIDTILPGDYYR